MLTDLGVTSAAVLDAEDVTGDDAAGVLGVPFGLAAGLFEDDSSVGLGDFMDVLGDATLAATGEGVSFVGVSFMVLLLTSFGVLTLVGGVFGA